MAAANANDGGGPHDTPERLQVRVHTPKRRRVAVRDRLVGHVRPDSARVSEPRNAVGWYDPLEDRYTLYAGTQGPHKLKNELAEATLKIPAHKLRVVSPDVGGAFGGNGGDGGTVDPSTTPGISTPSPSSEAGAARPDGPAAAFPGAGNESAAPAPISPAFEQRSAG